MLIFLSFIDLQFLPFFYDTTFVIHNYGLCTYVHIYIYTHIYVIYIYIVVYLVPKHPVEMIDKRYTYFCTTNGTSVVLNDDFFIHCIWWVFLNIFKGFSFLRVTRYWTVIMINGYIILYLKKSWHFFSHISALDANYTLRSKNVQPCMANNFVYLFLNWICEIASFHLIFQYILTLFYSTINLNRFNFIF